MAAVLTEEDLKDKAIAYLKQAYDEDTVWMKVQDNGVEGESGTLHVECRVRIGGAESDWTKWFSFEGGAVTGMRWKAH
jgi:hypothetical protein